MPWGDRTGPAGLGPMTGRGLGYCSGYNQPGYTTSGFGWGRGRGRGFGRGWGRGWGMYGYPYGAAYPYPPYAPVQPSSLKEEKEMLLEELKTLKEETKAIEEQLKSLKGSKKNKVGEE